MATTHTSRTGTFPEEGIKAPCVVSTSANITLSGEQTIGSTAVVAGDRVLTRAQTNAAENGIWDVAVGAWTRASDWENDRDVSSGVMVIDAANTMLYQAVFTGDFVAGTTLVTFSQPTSSDALLKNSASLQTVNSEVSFQGDVTIDNLNAAGNLDFTMSAASVLTVDTTPDNIRVRYWHVFNEFGVGFNEVYSGMDDVDYTPNSDQCAIRVTCATNATWANSSIDTRYAGRFRLPRYTNSAQADTRCQPFSNAEKEACFGYNMADKQIMFFNGTNWVLAKDGTTLAS